MNFLQKQNKMSDYRLTLKNKKEIFYVKTYRNVEIQ